MDEDVLDLFVCSNQIGSKIWINIETNDINMGLGRETSKSKEVFIG